MVENRLQNIVITLDKVKRYLGEPGQPQGPPLHMLTDDEATSFLWTGERSIMRRALLHAAAPYSFGPVGTCVF